MSIERGRQRAESLMTLTVRAYRPSGYSGTPEVLQFVDEGTHRAKVQGVAEQGMDTGTRFVTVGGVSRPIGTASLHVPVGAPLPTAGDEGLGWEYLVTAVGALADVALLNRRYRVVNVPAKSFATARRLDVVEVP